MRQRPKALLEKVLDNGNQLLKLMIGGGERGSGGEGGWVGEVLLSLLSCYLYKHDVGMFWLSIVITPKQRFYL